MDNQTYDITELLDRLMSGSPEDRLAAVNNLSEISADEAIAGLVIALEDEDASVREQAAECLSNLHGETATALLSEFLGNKNITTRNLAAEILVRIGADAVPGLLGWIKHEDHDVRKFVVDTLGLIGDLQATEELEQALWDENMNVSCSAAESLGMIGEPSTTRALIGAAEKLSDIRPQVIEALGRIGNPNAVEFLLDCLNMSDSMLVFLAAEALGNIASPEALKKLSEIVNDESVEIGEEAFKSALKISEALDVDLKTHVNDDRMRTFVTSGYINDDRSIIGFTERNPDIWKDEALALALIENASEINEFNLKLATRSIVRVNPSFDRVIAARIKVAPASDKTILLELLSSCVSASCIDEIREFANDDDSQVREKAALTLGRLVDERALPILRELAADSVGHVRGMACKAMGWIADSSSVETLIAGLDDSYPDVREACVGALVTIGGQNVVDHFTSDLEHAKPERRRLAALALGWIGEESASAPLKGALSHSDPEVRRAALMAIRRMNVALDLDVITVLLADEDDSVQKVAMTALGEYYPDQATNILSNYLKDDDVMLQIHIISVLKQVGSLAAHDLLKETARDSSMVARVASVNALASIDDPHMVAFFDSLDACGDQEVEKALITAKTHCRNSELL